MRISTKVTEGGQDVTSIFTIGRLWVSQFFAADMHGFYES